MLHLYYISTYLYYKWPFQGPTNTQRLQSSVSPGAWPKGAAARE